MKKKKFFRKLVIRRDDGQPYLIRRTLLTIGEIFSIKYHNIVMSDDECMHDHPWKFVSIILKGGYYEISDNDGKLRKSWYGPGSILCRPATWVHRLQLKEDPKTGEALKCKTLIFTFKRVREWGFITKVSGWVHYKQYSTKHHCEDNTETEYFI